jgi:tetratricopeptide (TPR) repeat protein
MILWPNSRARLCAIGIGLLLAGCSWMSRTGPSEGAATDHVKKGIILEEAGDLDRALAEYQTARAADQENPAILIDLGNVHVRMKKYAEAEKYYRDALDLDPQNAMANNNLAWIFVIQGIHFSEAEGLIRKAMYADPGRVSVYLDTMAYLYLRQERFDEALNTLKAAENLLPPGDETLAAELANTRTVISRYMLPDENAAPADSAAPSDGSEESPQDSLQESEDGP